MEGRQFGCHARPAPEIFRGNPYPLDDRFLFYAPSIGTDPGFADIIIDQAGITKS